MAFEDTFKSGLTNVMTLLFSISPRGKFMTGARCKISINGEIAVFAFSVSWNIRTDYDEIMVIDEFMPYEFAPKKITVEGTIGGFRIPAQGPSKMQIQPSHLSFLFHKYIGIEVRDWRTNTLLFKVDKAVITNRQEDFKSGELATMSLSWKAIGWQDDNEPTMPIDPK